MNNFIIHETLKIILYGTVTILFVAVNALFLVWMERRVAARIQLRRGPIHVGPQGLLQTIADAVKLISKELSWPKNADKFCYWLAPVLVFSPLLSAFLIFPFSKNFILRDLNVGFLFAFALTNIRFIGIFIAGWSSNNKYALLGSMRAVAQNISYEIPLILSTMGVVLVAQTMKMTELVAGFHTEYSGMRFALFFLGEYTAIFISSAIAATIFLGGWQGPFLPGA